jgi:cell division protein FtsN
MGDNVTNYLYLLRSQAKPSQAKPSQAKPSQAKPSQAKPSQAKPSQAKVLTGDGDLREAQPPYLLAIPAFDR